MARFTNQAQLDYNGTTINSNLAVGEILEALSMNKTAVLPNYNRDSTVTYVVNINNTSDTAWNNLTYTDNLGSYNFIPTDLVPLEYINNSIKVFQNGIPQAPVTVAGVNPLILTGVNVPANGTTTIVYETAINEYAPIGVGGTVRNEASLSGAGLTSPVTAEATINAETAPDLTINKTISPVPVTENSPVTYTFTVENYGNTAVLPAESLILSDTFNPILSNISATLNGRALMAGEYNYNESTGAFSTTNNLLAVPAATIEQDPNTGAWTTSPGQITLTVTGTI